MARMELPRKRKQGRPKRRFMIAVRGRRRMQKLGPNGYGKSAEATTDGRSQKKKKEVYYLD